VKLPPGVQEYVEGEHLEVMLRSGGDVLEIGHGYFSDILKAKWIKQTGPAVAIKRHKNFVGNFQIQTEIERMSVLGHEHAHLVGFYGVVTLLNADRPSPVMDCGDYRNLFFFLLRCRERGLRGEKMIRIASQIADGMDFMHKQNLFHGGLRTSNCLIDRRRLHVKVGDIGHHDFRVDGKGHPPDYTKKDTSPDARVSKVVSCAWWAPECQMWQWAVDHMEKKVPPTKRVAEGDFWSFGCVLFEIWTLGCGPFRQLWWNGTNNNQDAPYRIATALHQNELPSGRRRLWMRYPVKELMKECWNKEKNDRPKFDKILSRLRGLLPHMM